LKPEFGRQDLDRDVAVERGVGRPSDGAHPALADVLDDAAMEQGRAGRDLSTAECLTTRRY